MSRDVLQARVAASFDGSRALGDLIHPGRRKQLNAWRTRPSWRAAAPQNRIRERDSSDVPCARVAPPAIHRVPDREPTPRLSRLKEGAAPTSQSWLMSPAAIMATAAGLTQGISRCGAEVSLRASCMRCCSHGRFPKALDCTRSIHMPATMPRLLTFTATPAPRYPSGLAASAAQCAVPLGSRPARRRTPGGRGRRDAFCVTPIH